ncbi:hypothetical protein CLV47_11243 [Antricoccus suffuscus]|uniref:Uncharacterized protein n=2 Tax=Antricoccus suffuscus TaxID=1629062 RepID=A0A2T0ZXD4_9ACTN|nr:hypothetical protein CLV47_11243 [Antricoccus suffuscus]
MSDREMSDNEMSDNETSFGGTPIVDLGRALADLRPKLRPGRFVFVSVPSGSLNLLSSAEATVAEDEGLTAVLSQEVADEAGLKYDYVGGWITLRVLSDLSLVGLTAAVAQRLTASDISCNVIAGRYHDHIVVPWDRREHAVAALMELADEARESAA